MRSPDLALAGAADRGFGAAFMAAAKRHRVLYAVALFTLALATAIGSRTGVYPDLHVLGEYGFYLLCALWICGCAFAVFRILWLGLVERSPSPTRALLGSFARFLGDAARLANTLHGFAALMTFISGFSVLKGAIAVIRPFNWDLTLSEWDRALHFGLLPYEWLGWITEWPFAVFLVNVSYHFWFVILLGLVFSAIVTNRDTALRHRFLLSYMLLWLVGGFMIASGFSSAGPCYFAKLGLGEDYQPLMDALVAANRVHPVWALDVQDLLWDGYSGTGQASLGISAFPSLHVATSVLMALYAGNRWRHAGPPLWAFAGLVMVGSVALGWHYAVDGYAGALIAVAVWKALGAVVTEPVDQAAGRSSALALSSMPNRSRGSSGSASRSSSS
ncbi:MAG TPA: phosphatase PAP2 family protein [Mesorhizobium sp.]|jgi:hypothetical protein|nr:phosphatase PAP2 family protein [Mesorhizobium sp.]